MIPCFYELRATTHFLIAEEASNKVITNTYLSCTLSNMGLMIEDYVNGFKAKAKTSRLKDTTTPLKKEEAFV